MPIHVIFVGTNTKFTVLLETFDSTTLMIHSDYSAIYDIKNKNRVNSSIDTHLHVSSH